MCRLGDLVRIVLCLPPLKLRGRVVIGGWLLLLWLSLLSSDSCSGRVGNDDGVDIDDVDVDVGGEGDALDDGTPAGDEEAEMEAG